MWSDLNARPAVKLLIDALRLAFPVVWNNPNIIHNAKRAITEFRVRSLRKESDPIFLQLEPTSYCNFKCVYCLTHNGTRADSKGHMSPETFQRCLNRFTEAAFVHLQGQGEPFLNKHIFEFVRELNDRHKLSSIITNGSLLNAEAAEKMLRVGVSQLLVSLDANPKQDMEAIRQGLDYDRVISNIRTLLTIRRQVRAKTIIGLSTVVFPAAAREIRSRLAYYDDLGIDLLFMTTLSSTPDYLNCYGSRFDDDHVRMPELHRFLSTVRTRCRKVTTANFWILDSCTWPWLYAYVNYDGSLSFCCNTHRRCVGSIHDDDPMNSPSFMELRRAFAESRDLNPACVGCNYIPDEVSHAGRVLPKKRARHQFTVIH